MKRGSRTSSSFARKQLEAPNSPRATVKPSFLEKNERKLCRNTFKAPFFMVGFLPLSQHPHIDAELSFRNVTARDETCPSRRVVLAVVTTPPYCTKRKPSHVEDCRTEKNHKMQNGKNKTKKKFTGFIRGLPSEKLGNTCKDAEIYTHASPNACCSQCVAHFCGKNNTRKFLGATHFTRKRKN